MKANEKVPGMIGKFSEAAYRISAVIALILAYLYYNSMRFAYLYYDSIHSSYSDPVLSGLVLPFLFSLVLVMMIFILLDKKEKLRYVAAAALLILIFYNPTVHTYEKALWITDPEAAASLSQTVSFLNKLDFFHILNTGYYKGEVSAILICCILIYLFKDLRIRYSLPWKAILLLEILVCALGDVCLLWLFQFGTDISKTLIIISAVAIVVCFLVSKGLAVLLLRSPDLRLPLGTVVMIVPWMMNIAFNSRYSSPGEGIGLLLIPLVLIGLNTFLCYAIERCNDK